jgi:K+-sensing histidine kinase KdpD
MVSGQRESGQRNSVQWCRSIRENVGGVVVVVVAAVVVVAVFVVVIVTVFIQQLQEKASRCNN